MTTFHDSPGASAFGTAPARARIALLAEPVAA